MTDSSDSVSIDMETPSPGGKVTYIRIYASCMYVCIPTRVCVRAHIVVFVRSCLVGQKMREMERNEQASF
uniref:Uncharacterized protein n=1 Tax=Rhizophora mucronata TaxID=61149 RepID=A0A2P2M5D5_RHIMU